MKNQDQTYLAGVGHARNAPPHNVKTNSGGYRNGKRCSLMSAYTLRQLQDAPKKPISRSKRRAAKKAEYARLRREIMASGGLPAPYIPPVCNR